MSRVLLADDSPHAQRMGERILRDEGYEVVTVTDGVTALLRLPDVDPDLVFADASLPRKSGYEICREIKSRPRHSHVRVVLTAGMLEPFDDKQAEAVRCDAVMKKPFEASAMLEAIKPLLEAAAKDRLSAETLLPAPDGTTPPPASTIDPERVRAAVTLALDAALPLMIDRITEQVLIALDR